MNKVKHKRYKNFAGPVLYGHTRMAQPADDTFLEKLVYVTAMVESGGFYGSVFMADGTGITGGLCQHVAILPRQMEYGGFWKLMAFIDAFFPVIYYDLGDLLIEEGWTFQPDGRLRDYTTDIEVPPFVFRQAVTPRHGVVPPPEGYPDPDDTDEEISMWRQAKLWCLAVHQILAQPATHRAQLIYECRHFQKMIERTHFKGILEGKRVGDVAFPNSATRSPFDDPRVELAMLVFLSFAVNAPKWAYTAFESALELQGYQGQVPLMKSKQSRLFARELIKQLERVGGSKWDDDRKYGRYQRTRDVLKTMFDSDVVDDVMPEDLPEE